jgi:hypothetical protein
LSAYGTATPAYTTGSVGAATRQIAPDALGNVWVTNNGTTLYQYSASGGGAATNTYTIASGDVFGVAIDKANNVWVANAVLTTPNITEYAYSGGTYTPNYTATVPVSGTLEPVSLAIDANQNVWAAPYYTVTGYTANSPMVLPNLTPGGAATYTTSGTTGIEEIIPTLTSGVITSITAQSLITGTALGAKASQIPGIDGAGTIYLPDNQGSGLLGVHAYSSVAVTSSNTGSQVLSPPAGYLGCYLATPTTTICGTGSSSAVYNPREISIDSTGSVWAGISTSGGLTQLIGLGAPTWPLLQTGKPGLSPGSSTVTPLP